MSVFVTAGKKDDGLGLHFGTSLPPVALRLGLGILGRMAMAQRAAGSQGYTALKRRPVGRSDLWGEKQAPD
jgi:hypothetical protein